MRKRYISTFPLLSLIECIRVSLINAHYFSYIQSKVVERHFFDLSQRYGETIAVDLTDKVPFFSLSFHANKIHPHASRLPL